MGALLLLAEVIFDEWFASEPDILDQHLSCPLAELRRPSGRPLSSYMLGETPSNGA